VRIGGVDLRLAAYLRPGLATAALKCVAGAKGGIPAHDAAEQSGADGDKCRVPERFSTGKSHSDVLGTSNGE
jgi:hypothetical protein